MRTKTFRLSLRLFLPLVLLAGASFDGLAQLPSGKDRQLHRQILHQVKEDLQKNYYDPSFPGFDLEARFISAEHELVKVNSNQGAYLIIAGTLEGLQDSHTFFVPPPWANPVSYGWRLQMIGGHCLVTAVKPGSDAEAHGLKAGDMVSVIDGTVPTRKNFWLIRYIYDVLAPRTSVHMDVISPQGIRRRIDVKSKVRQRQGLRLAAYDWFIQDREGEWERHLTRQRMKELDKGLIVWKMPHFEMTKDEIDLQMRRVKGHDALILDLRGNGGGDEEALLHMLSYFIESDTVIGKMKRRKETKPMSVKPRRTGTYHGKLVVLIDSASASAAEIFSRVIQLQKRGTLIGERSSGSVMRARYFLHEENLGALVYAVSVTDADIIFANGERLEGAGVEPDEITLPTPDDISALRDPTLARAAAILGVSITPESAGALFPIEWSPY